MTETQLERMLADLRPYWKAGRAAWSMRRSQRAAALWIAMMIPAKKVDGVSVAVAREDLRAACRFLRVYDTALFSYYMNDRHWGWAWFVPVTVKGKKLGWNLTREARAEAEKLFA